MLLQIHHKKLVVRMYMRELVLMIGEMLFSECQLQNQMSKNNFQKQLFCRILPDDCFNQLLLPEPLLQRKGLKETLVLQRFYEYEI